MSSALKIEAAGLSKTSVRFQRHLTSQKTLAFLSRWHENLKCAKILGSCNCAVHHSGLLGCDTVLLDELVPTRLWGRNAFRVKQSKRILEDQGAAFVWNMRDLSPRSHPTWPESSTSNTSFNLLSRHSNYVATGGHLLTDTDKQVSHCKMLAPRQWKHTSL